MYIPRIFKNEDEVEIKNFLRENSFGILVTAANQQILATHIPMELEENDGEWYLRGHVSKANPQWKIFEKECEVLAIFSGPHTYISSSWYSHVNVPTWNYIAVHLSGKIKILEGAALYQSLKNLVDKYEQHSENPVRVETMPEDYLRREMRGIVGFEIKIEKIEGKKKLSQNRKSADFENVIKMLEKREDASSQAVAKAMRKIKK